LLGLPAKKFHPASPKAELMEEDLKQKAPMLTLMELCWREGSDGFRQLIKIQKKKEIADPRWEYLKKIKKKETITKTTQ